MKLYNLYENMFEAVNYTRYHASRIPFDHSLTADEVAGFANMKPDQDYQKIGAFNTLEEAKKAAEKLIPETYTIDNRYIMRGTGYMIEEATADDDGEEYEWGDSYDYYAPLTIED